MADPPPYPDSGADNGEDIETSAGLESAAGTPLWVKVFGIIALVLLLLFVILHLTGRGLGGH